jgi:hypothetical protein
MHCTPLACIGPAIKKKFSIVFSFVSPIGFNFWRVVFDYHFVFLLLQRVVYVVG